MYERQVTNCWQLILVFPGQVLYQKPAQLPLTPLVNNPKAQNTQIKQQTVPIAEI